MTPEQHAKAIEDAAHRYARDFAVYCDGKEPADLKVCNVSLAALQASIRAGVGAAPLKDSAEFALAALVAAGHVSQEKVDEARALVPEGGHVPKAAPDGWQLVPVEPTAPMLSKMAECDGYLDGDRDRPGLIRWEDYWRNALAAAPKP